MYALACYELFFFLASTSLLDHPLSTSLRTLLSRYYYLSNLSEQISNITYPFFHLVEKLSWELAVTCGTPPSARDCHSCSLWNNKIIVIAGEDSSDCYLSDVHILDAGISVFQDDVDVI